MANGDAALAAGMDVVPGTADRRNGYDEINKTRDYIATRTSAVTPISKGGTGATSAAGARANLGVQATVDDVADATPAGDTGAAAGGKLVRFNEAGRIGVNTPTSDGQAVNKGYCDGNSGVKSTGGTFTGDVKFPNATPATSGYTVAYLNGDGRLSRGASSERYKKDITPIDPAELGDIWPQLVAYQMIDGDGAVHYGHIAERLDEHPDQQPFVVYGALPGEHIPESIDFIALLLAQTAQLHQQIDLLAQRIAELEEPA